MDKKIKQLENQALPDLSRMDEHWKVMATMLQPGVEAPKPGNGNAAKFLRWFIAAVFVAALSFLIYQFSKPASTIEEHAPAIIVNNVPTDTIPVNQVAIETNKVIAETQPTVLKASAKTVLIKPGKPVIQVIDNTIVDTVAIPSTQTGIPEPAGTTLTKFFKSMEQQPQQFVIDSRKDTMIAGEKGTVLLIPANTFAGASHITITLKEYYSYADIITNKLTTMSGSSPLITGGMIHVIATVDGKQVNMQPEKSIRWFVPDTSAAISKMQLFNGTTTPPPVYPSGYVDGDPLPKDFLRLDTATGNIEMLNWVPQDQYFTTTWIETRVKVLNLMNEPWKKKMTAKGEVGYFFISQNPKISRDELTRELKEKYGYHKVKVKKRPKDGFFLGLIPKVKRLRFQSKTVGDSAWLSNEIAKMYNLQATDTVSTTQKGYRYSSGSYVKKTFANINLNALADRYSVDIRTLGWINCDRFYDDKRQKLDYFVDLKDSAINYYTVLVFDKLRSMVKGVNRGDRVVFPGVPKGESAKVICIGIQNGQPVAAMEPLPAVGTLVSNLRFEATDPFSLRRGIEEMDR